MNALNIIVKLTDRNKIKHIVKKTKSDKKKLVNVYNWNYSNQLLFGTPNKKNPILAKSLQKVGLVKFVLSKRRSGVYPRG